MHHRRRRPVCHVCGDLERGPQAADPAHDRGVHAEVEDVLGIGRVERRDVEVGERHLRRAGDGRTLGCGIVADERYGTAVGMRADEVGVAYGVGCAVEAGRLAVPVADDAVALLAVVVGRERAECRGELRSHDRRRGEFFVETWAVYDVEGCEERLTSHEFEVEACERRAFVAGDERRRAQILSPVDAGAVGDHPDERCDPAEEDRTFFAGVSVVECEIGGACRRTPSCLRRC